jgi:hypothetical protein
VRRAADEATVLRLETATYTVPTDAPEADGTLAWDSITLVLVHVFPADGTTGLGWTYAGRACQTLIDDQLTGTVLGRSALDVPGCLEAMVRACRNLGRPDVVSCAIAAVELAMWDLKARLLGLPLCRLLGQVHEQVPVYGSVGFTSYDDAQLRAQLELWTQELRIPRVKIKIGESCGACEQRDLAGVRQAREVVGPDVVLYVDANGGYSPAHAVRVGQQLAEQDVTWFEEPVSSDDLAGLARIRGGVRLRPHLLRTDVRGRRGRLPAGRRHPLQRGHRVAAGVGGRGSARAGRQRAPRSGTARTSPRRGEPAAHGVLPRPRPDRAPAVRRSAAGARRHADAGRPGLGLELRRGRRAVPGGLTAGRGNA